MRLTLILICLAACDQDPALPEGPAGPFYDHYLYLESVNLIRIIDFADLAAPRQVGILGVPDGYLSEPLVAGETLILNRYDIDGYRHEYLTYDLADPAQPTLITRAPAPGANSLALYDNFGYLVEPERGELQIYDYTEPLKPALLATAPTSAVGFPQLNDDFALAAVFGWCGRFSYCLQAVDFYTRAESGELRFVHNVPLDSRFNTENFLLRDTLLFYYLIERLNDRETLHTVRVVDLAAPTHDNLVAAHHLGGRPLFLSPDLILLQEFSQSEQFKLRLLDSSDSHEFSEQSHFTLNGFPEKALWHADQLFVAYQRYSPQQRPLGLALAVLDFSDLATPIWLADVPLE